MLLSSSERHYDTGFEVRFVVAEHGPEDVDAASCEGDQRLFVGFAFCSFPVVEGA